MLTFDYDNFNKKGLKKVTDYLGKEGLPVADVKGDNKQTREAGFPIKTAIITFESGQVLLVKAKLDGGIYQWKLNNKVLAIKNYLQLDAAIKEVVSFVKANEPNYLKQKEKALAKQKVLVPTVKPVNTTVEEQTAAFQTTLDDLAGQNEALNNQIADVKTQTASRQAELDALAVQIAAENERSKALETQLEKAKQGIFESAGDGDYETCCPQCGATMEFDESGKAICPACGYEMHGQESTGVDSPSPAGPTTACCSDCCVQMEKTGDDRYRCPQCGAVYEDKEGIIAESAAMKCPECEAMMDEPTADDGDCSMICRECGCKIGTDGMVMESGCKKKTEVA